MIQFRSFSVAIVAGGMMFFSRPAAAQYGNVSKSLMHVVSVTVAPRVKVELSPLSLMSSHSVPAAVEMTSRPAAEGLALSVQATQSWVLSMKSRASARPGRDTKLHWSSSPRGEFTAITAVDTVLVAGKASASPADTAVFFRAAQHPGTSANGDEAAVILTVSAP